MIGDNLGNLAASGLPSAQNTQSALTAASQYLYPADQTANVVHQLLGGQNSGGYVGVDDYIGHTIDTLKNVFQNPFALGDVYKGILDPNAKPQNQYQAEGANSALGKASATVGDLLGIVTDIPRMLTLVVGLLLLGVGIFALARGPVVNITKSVGLA